MLTDNLIRPADRADAPGVARVLREVFAETYGAAIPAEILANYLAREFADDVVATDLAQPAAIDLVAQVGGSIAGVCRLAANPPPIEVAGRAVIELTKLYIGAAFRGRGLGEQLLAAAILAARERGRRAIWLAVWEQNRRALAFYRRHSFRNAGRMSIFVDGIEFHDLVMLRGLDDR